MSLFSLITEGFGAVLSSTAGKAVMATVAASTPVLAKKAYDTVWNLGANLISPPPTLTESTIAARALSVQFLGFTNNNGIACCVYEIVGNESTPFVPKFSNSTVIKRLSSKSLLQIYRNDGSVVTLKDDGFYIISFDDAFYYEEYANGTRSQDFMVKKPFLKPREVSSLTASVEILEPRVEYTSGVLSIPKCLFITLKPSCPTIFRFEDRTNGTFFSIACEDKFTFFYSINNEIWSGHEMINNNPPNRTVEYLCYKDAFGDLSYKNPDLVFGGKKLDFNTAIPMISSNYADRKVYKLKRYDSLILMQDDSRNIAEEEFTDCIVGTDLVNESLDAFVQGPHFRSVGYTSDVAPFTSNAMALLRISAVRCPLDVPKSSNLNQLRDYPTNLLSSVPDMLLTKMQRSGEIIGVNLKETPYTQVYVSHDPLPATETADFGISKITNPASLSDPVLICREADKPNVVENW